MNEHIFQSNDGELMLATDEPTQDELADAIRAEVESIDIGNFAKDEDERILHRYLRRRAQLDAELTHIVEQTTAMVSGLKRRIESLDYVFKGYAEQIARRKITGKTKSLRTPFGIIGFRTVKPLLQVVDEAAAIRALEALPGTQDCVVTVKRVAKEALNLYVKNTGELPDGCEVRPGGEKFFVR